MVYRVSNAPVYNIYWRLGSAPKDDDVPLETTPTLPYTTTTTFADGEWYVAVKYFNGITYSGFLPLGPHGETYLKIIVSGGVVVGNPPLAPQFVQLAQGSAGAISVEAGYSESGDLRADEWAIAYTNDGTTPPTDTPTITATIGASGFVSLRSAFPTQASGATFKCRVQTRRNDGTDTVPVWVYSDRAPVVTEVIDTY